jgi:hypothetical protein
MEKFNSVFCQEFLAWLVTEMVNPVPAFWNQFADVQGEYKLSEDFVPVAVCTDTTAVVTVECSSLWAPVSSTVDWLSAQISWGCE